VRRISYSVNATLFAYLGHRADGQAISPDDF
jgi:hypothetical protein